MLLVSNVNKASYRYDAVNRGTLSFMMTQIAIHLHVKPRHFWLLLLIFVDLKKKIFYFIFYFIYLFIYLYIYLWGGGCFAAVDRVIPESALIQVF